jgi:anaerobic selenocysteine-containing dehydrogenase
MITHAGNPVLSAAGEDRLDEAFASLDFHVAVDLYVTETSRHADVSLPPVSHLEREEFDLVFGALSVRNNARFNDRVVQPPADGMDDWEIMARLVVEVLPLPLRAVTGRIAAKVTEQLDPMRLAAVGIATGPHGVLRRGRDGLTLGKVRRTRGGIDLGALEPRLHELVTRPGGRVQLAPPDLVAELGEVLAGADATEPDDGYDLRLIGRRHLRSNNSWLHNVATMVKGRDRCTVLLHPEDAASRGIEDRAAVAVSSPHGRIELPAEVSDEIRSGTVAIPHGWGHDRKGVGWSTAAAHGGVNVNRLHDPHRVDPVSGNGALNATWVRLEPVAVGATA